MLTMEPVSVPIRARRCYQIGEEVVKDGWGVPNSCVSKDGEFTGLGGGSDVMHGRGIRDDYWVSDLEWMDNMVAH